MPVKKKKDVNSSTDLCCICSNSSISRIISSYKFSSPKNKKEIKVCIECELDLLREAVTLVVGKYEFDQAFATVLMRKKLIGYDDKLQSNLN